MTDISELREKLFGPPDAKRRWLNDEAKMSAMRSLVMDGMSIGRAANKVGLSRSNLRALTLSHPEFMQELDDAYNLGTDYLEDLALERAHESDSVLIKLLESRRPEKFSSRRIVQGGPVVEIRRITDENKSPVPVVTPALSNERVESVRDGGQEVLPRVAPPSGEG